MIRRNRKTLLIVCGLLIGCATQPATAKAGIIADTWMAVFGPPGTPYFPGAYRGYYYGPSYYSTSYRGNCCPPVRVYYVPRCRPCNPCGIVCPTPCNPCNIGNCPVKSGTAENRYDRGEPPQTFKKPAKEEKKDGDKDSKFKSRDGSKKFKTDPKSKSASDPKKEEPPFPTPAGNGDGDKSSGTGATVRKVLKVPDNANGKKNPGSVIGRKKPVQAKTPALKTKTKKKESKKKEESGTPGKKDVPALKLPNFDEKIVWQPAVQRTRLIINSRIPQPQLTRTIVDPNKGWKPVRNDTRVVRK